VANAIVPPNSGVALPPSAEPETSINKNHAKKPKKPIPIAGAPIQLRGGKTQKNPKPTRRISTNLLIHFKISTNKRHPNLRILASVLESLCQHRI
jgi:hypothetical protein